MATSPTKQGKTARIHAAVLPEVKDRFNALCEAYKQSGGGLMAILIDAEYKAHEERERRRKQRKEAADRLAADIFDGGMGRRW